METLLYRKYLKRMENIDRKLEEVKELATPIDEKEFYNMIKEELPEMTELNLKDHIKKKYQEASKKSEEVTKWDVYHSKIQLEDFYRGDDDMKWKKKVTIQDLRDRGETYIIPKEVTLTPFPKFDEYNPEDLYSLRDDISMPIRPNLNRQEEWFDKPSKYEREYRNVDIKDNTQNISKSMSEQIDDIVENREKNLRRAGDKKLYKEYHVPTYGSGMLKYYEPNPDN